MFLPPSSLPYPELPGGRDAGLPLKGECRKMIQGGGVSINKDKVTDIDYQVSDQDILDGKYILAQRGKKNYYIINIV